jgi:hypothetical protein
LRTIGASVALVCAAHPALATAPIVGAGCGRFLAAALARQDARSYVDFAMLVGADTDAELGEWVATCAPSVAVGLLAASATSAERPGAGETMAA